MGSAESKNKSKHISSTDKELLFNNNVEDINKDNMWLNIPKELLILIIELLDDPISFRNVSLSCKYLSNICQDPIVQYGAKLRFTTKHTSLLNLVLQPGGERVYIRHHCTLPCGTKFGEETTWNHSVKLQLLLREGGLCLQGVVDVKDKILANKKWWEDDRVVGEELGFFPDGKVQFVRFWDPEGNLDGEEQIFYDNGNLKVKNYRQNGVLEGVQQGWFREGNRSFVRLWRKGVLEGPEKEWNEIGELTTHVVWPVNNKGKRLDILKSNRKKEKKTKNPFKKRNSTTATTTTTNNNTDT